MAKAKPSAKDLHIEYLQAELTEQRRIVRELLDRLVARDAGALYMPGAQMVGPVPEPEPQIADQTGLIYGPDSDDEDKDLDDLNEMVAEWDRVAGS